MEVGAEEAVEGIRELGVVGVLGAATVVLAAALVASGSGRGRTSETTKLRKLPMPSREESLRYRISHGGDQHPTSKQNKADTLEG